MHESRPVSAPPVGWWMVNATWSQAGPERMEVREQATSDDRLLDREDPGTRDPEVVRRWTAVYAELIAFKQDLISRIELEHRAADPAAKAEVSLDLDLVKREKARLEGRLSFWRFRQLLLGDVMDEGGGSLSVRSATARCS